MMCPFSHGFICLTGIISALQLPQAHCTKPYRELPALGADTRDLHFSHLTSHISVDHGPDKNPPSPQHQGALSSSKKHALSGDVSYSALLEHIPGGQNVASGDTKDKNSRTSIQKHVSDQNDRVVVSVPMHFMLMHVKDRLGPDLKMFGQRLAEIADRELTPHQKNRVAPNKTRHISRRSRKLMKYSGISQQLPLASSHPHSSPCYHRSKRRAIHRTKNKHKEHSHLSVSSSSTPESSSAKTEIPDSVNTTRDQLRTKRAHTTAHKKPIDPKAKNISYQTPPASGAQTTPVQKRSSSKPTDAFLNVDGKPLNMTLLMEFFRDRARDREMMRQAQWAYLCLVLLVILMLGAIWCLGVRCRYKPEKHRDFHDTDHMLSMKEILWRKRHYLPMAQDQDWVEVKVCDCGTNTGR